MRKKNAAAVALGRKGGKARLTKLTPERRSEIARLGANARNGKPTTLPEPQRWYGVVLIPMPAELRGGTKAMAKILDDSHTKPNIVLWTTDREEARDRMRRENLAGQCAEILDIDYNPTRFTVVREYKPDASRQLNGLKAILNSDAGEGGQS